MKHFSFTVIIILLSSFTLAAQTYRVIGYAGKDTIRFGTTELGKENNFIFPLDDYKGKIELIPANVAYHELEAHLQQMKTIQSVATFNAAKAYVNDTLDFETLYSSGMWKEYIQYWVGFYAQATQSPEEFTQVFIPIAKQVLVRIAESSPQTGIYLIQDLLGFFEQFGLQQASENLTAFSMGVDLKLGEHSDFAVRVLTSMKLTGKSAPEIVNQGKTEKFSCQTILFFHEIGCNNCDEQLSELIKNYESLQSKGYEVVSIAGENNPETFKVVAEGLPWMRKFYDEERFEGANFLNYGVFATPVIYLIDKEGIVQGKYARLDEIFP